jgi:plastocyanin
MSEVAPVLQNPAPSHHPAPGQLSWYQKRSNQVLLVIATVILLLLVLTLGHHQPKAALYKAPTPAIAKVSLTGSGFSPATITVKTGNIVEWTSRDELQTHQVAANPLQVHSELPSLVSNQLGQGAVYRYKFTKAGTYHYHDEVNPMLNGTVVVQ